jgi:hypothetical protein
VPGLSPLDTKKMLDSEISLNAYVAYFMPLIFYLVVRQTTDDEVIVYHIMAIHECAFLQSLELLFLCLHEDNVRIASLANLDRSAGAYGNNVEFYS